MLAASTTVARAARAAPLARDRCSYRRLRPLAFRNNGEQRQQPPAAAATTTPKPPVPIGSALHVKPLTTAGAALTAEESASLARVLELAPAAKPPGAAAPTAPATAAAAPLQSHLLAVLNSAAEHGASPDLPLLEGAILFAEQLYLQQQQQQQQQQQTALPLAAATAPAAVAPLARGVPTWQPVFASAGGWPRLLFIPVPEFFVGCAASGGDDRALAPAFDVVTELGFLTTHFLGQRRWAAAGSGGVGGGGEEEGGAVLEYEVHKVRIEWVGGGSRDGKGEGKGITISLPPPLRLKNSLAFFAATPRWALARSRLGGTMLLRADPPAGRKYENITQRR